jgi:NosR/NirI family transcriptional regulator, nitrous oxide reductase regulator
VARAHVAAQEKGDSSGLAAAAARAAPGTRQVERHTSLTWQELTDQRAVQSLSLTRGQIEDRFAGTRAAGADKRAAGQPEELALAFHTALISVPQIGRNLLDDAGWRQLGANLRRASQALLVTESGPLASMAYESQRVQRPVSYVLTQGGRELKLRAMPYDAGLAVPGYPKDQRAFFLLVDSATPLDPAQPFDLSFRLLRRYGSFPDQVAQADFALDYRLPNPAAWMAASYEPAWFAVWRQRAWEIAVLLAALVVLVVALVRQQWISASQRRLGWFRTGYLLFTLGFIGWYAQGQLTVVNLTAAADALASGGDLAFLLTDPISVILWVFAGITLLVWGRGTFCGWLCPFGALQELLSAVTRRLGLKPQRLRSGLDARLKWLKYGVLAAVLGSAFLTPSFAPAVAEVEPFKTAISAYFSRDWPYVLWAVACVALSVFVYRGYCRYICPLGAALAATDMLRRWAWIARRTECGTPCQSCRHRCEYQAIEPIGKVNYSECFQCLDCVAIHQDDTRCLPLIQQSKKEVRVIPIISVAAS